jgi:hypothetical protein
MRQAEGGRLVVPYPCGSDSDVVPATTRWSGE